MSIKTLYGTEVRIIREVEPFKCNGHETRMIEVEFLSGYNQHPTRVNLEYLKESEPGEIERALKQGKLNLDF